MSMTEPTAPPPAKKPRRKVARARRASTLPKKPSSEFTGMTVKLCPPACNAARCVISGYGVCAHPHKGGLQGADMHNPEAVAKLAAAKRFLGNKLLNPIDGG